MNRPRVIVLSNCYHVDPVQRATSDLRRFQLGFREGVSRIDAGSLREGGVRWRGAEWFAIASSADCK